MSYTELHHGKLKKVEREGCVSIESLCETLCKENGIWNKGIASTWEERLMYLSDLDEKYLVTKDEVYEILDHVKTEDNDYFRRVTKNPDGTISFIALFYNGGTCFREELSDGIDEMKKSN